jgi:xylulokinase
MTLALGIDVGTSGARAIAIDPRGQIQAQVSQSFEPVSPDRLALQWQTALEDLLTQLPVAVRHQIQAIAIAGTSATVLLCDGSGQPLAEPLLYNDARAITVLDRLRALVPPHHTVLSATSSLAKLLWYQQHPNFAQARFLMHQADWLAFCLHGQPGISDYHNSLKLGYEVGALGYPDWLLALDIAPLLPQVVAPGTAIGPIQPVIAQQLDLPPSCQVCAGTTDSIAAFLASGVQTPGDAVTSLGSTLVLKLLSIHRVDDGRYGIYSHRLGDMWLVGGASNTGGAVLRAFFSDDDLVRLSAQINPDRPSGLDYYPLLQPGDRFPINDPYLLPHLTPRPDDPVTFLYGLLEGIARIEAQGYERLQQLGSTPVQRVYTAGGGAINLTWQAIRQRWLGVPVQVASQTAAAYGAARLAARLAGGLVPG